MQQKGGSGIAIDLETGAVVLVDRENVTDGKSRKHGRIDDLIMENGTGDKNDVHSSIRGTYADIMEMQQRLKSPKGDDEMDWE